MARMVPQLTEERLALVAAKSGAEAKFYRECQSQLTDQYLVLFSLPWTGADSYGNVRDGEADFIIFDRESGFLVVEIKGGGITHEPAAGKWFTTNRTGSYEIKDPFEQAKTNKHRILNLLRAHPKLIRSGGARVLAGHAVFFPDIPSAEKLERPSSPLSIIGVRPDLSHLADWVKKTFDFWKGQSVFQALGDSGLAIAESIFCRPIEVKPLLSVQLEEEEQVRLRLTEQQAYLLSALGMRKRAAIAGGAGTGKTLLALFKAQKLAESGIRTLLLCYNRALADHLKTVYGRNENLLPMSFHQLCDWRVALVKNRTGRDLLAEAKRAYPNESLYDVQMPFALALSAEELPEDNFDAIIVDEGQDFRDEYWLSIELLLAQNKESYFYVFYDPNQSIYERATSFPISDPPFILSMNCRNTRFIHEAANRFYSGAEMLPPPIQGEPAEWIVADTVELQAKELHRHLSGLMKEQKIAAHEITVLVAGEPKNRFYQQLERLTLPAGVKWSWEEHRISNTVLVDTVRRFKGLESMIIFLWGIDSIPLETSREILYIGLSRAKARLFIVGSTQARTRFEKV